MVGVNFGLTGKVGLPTLCSFDWAGRDGFILSAVLRGPAFSRGRAQIGFSGGLP